MHKRCSCPIFEMAISNVDSWLHSPRTLFMLAFYIAFSYVVCHNYICDMENINYQVYWGESLYHILSNGCNVTMTSILFLISISEIPSHTGYHSYMLIRSSRFRWLLSQILYCFIAATIAFILVAVSVAIFILPPYTTLTNGWSDEVRLAHKIIYEEDALVPYYIRTTFSPVSAIFIAGFPTFLFWFTMALIILLCSLFKVPFIGIGLYAVLLIANVVFLSEAIDISMPIHYATLSNIIAGSSDDAEKKLVIALSGYILFTVFLTLIMKIKIKRTDLRFNE